MKNNQSQQGSALVVLLLIIVLAVVGGISWFVLKKDKPEQEVTTPQTQQTKETVQEKPKDPDSPSTMDAPETIAAINSERHFLYGAPAGHNNADPKKIIITLHGTGGSAERDYEVWKPFVEKTDYALASLGWWDGEGDQTSDYSTPEQIIQQIHNFLKTNNYTARDIVVFEGFSRGSANSYPIAAFDQASDTPLFDVVVSSSGGAQDAYYGMTTKNIASKAQSPTIFSQLKWITSCGDKDENPDRDGCGAMKNSAQFVQNKGATVLGQLEDPNAGHGALTTSSLDLVGRMFELVEGM